MASFISIYKLSCLCIKTWSSSLSLDKYLADLVGTNDYARSGLREIDFCQKKVIVDVRQSSVQSWSRQFFRGSEFRVLLFHFLHDKEHLLYLLCLNCSSLFVYPMGYCSEWSLGVWCHCVFLIYHSWLCRAFIYICIIIIQNAWVNINMTMELYCDLDYSY